MMATLAQLEKRLIVLEKAVQELQALSVRAEKSTPSATEEDFIPETECSIVVASPPAETIRCEAIVKFVGEPAPQGLGLSDAEWNTSRALIEIEEEKDVKP